MSVQLETLPNLIKAIYKHGNFEPIEPIPGLPDDQPVFLQIWSNSYEEFVVAEKIGDNSDTEWATLTAWEQQGKRAPLSSPAEAEAITAWVHAQWGSLPLPSTQALEIATADWLIEENLCL